MNTISTKDFQDLKARVTLLEDIEIQKRDNYKNPLFDSSNKSSWDMSITLYEFFKSNFKFIPEKLLFNDRLLMASLIKGIIMASDIQFKDKSSAMNYICGMVFKEEDWDKTSKLLSIKPLPKIIRTKTVNQPIPKLSPEELTARYNQKYKPQIDKAEPNDTRLAGRLKAQVNSTNLNLMDKDILLAKCSEDIAKKVKESKE